jgi:hypothetical protein
MNYFFGSPVLTNCTFSGNVAVGKGGGMYNSTVCKPELVNCTFFGNTAGDGGGIRNDKSSDIPTVTNCILWGNSDSGGMDESAQIRGGSPVIDYSCIQGWTGSHGGTGNIGDEPLFTDADGFDDVAGTEDDNLRLLPDSNCVDVGDNNALPQGIVTDLDGKQRIMNDIVDMGAYEFDIDAPIPGVPFLKVSPKYFWFSPAEDGSNPPDQTLTISNISDATLNWEIACECNWLEIDPNSGSSTGEANEVTVSVDTAGIIKGKYSCNVIISDPNASNNPQIVTVILEMLPIMLNYDAESYAYAHAVSPFGAASDTDTDQDFSSNSKVESLANADATYGPFPGWYSEWQRSWTNDSVEGIFDAFGANLISTFKGWGEWAWFEEGGGADGGSDGGDGNGYASLEGTIEIGVFEGYPQGSSGLILEFVAEVIGDAPSSWENWEWWLKIWDDDPNAPLALLNDSDTTSTIEVLAGQILNVEFYHEAEEDYWPEEGLESTVMIDLDLLAANGDLDGDGSVDFADFSLFGQCWRQQAEPDCTDADFDDSGCVDGKDLGEFVKNWLATL